MFTLINKSKMDKKQIINEFTKKILSEKQRKNKISTVQITNTMILSAINLAFPNESCKSSGAPKKSQRIYEKLDDIPINIIQKCFQKNTVNFLKVLKIFSRNRKFILAVDSTKEAFYGKLNKAKDPLYLHSGSIAKESYFYYEFLTITIVGNFGQKFILDGIILKRGDYIEDKVKKMLKFIKQHLSINLILFDRGFGWGIIKIMQELKLKYMIFWKKQGNWYKKYFEEMTNGEDKTIIKDYKYNRNKTNYKLKSKFVLIKQLEYENKKYDWIFATNFKLEKTKDYIKRYKKRWGIETIYRVTDKIRIYTTSTKKIIRYFLFMFTCFVYNIWKYFQIWIGKNLTLANFKINIIIYLTKIGVIYPTDYNKFENIALGI